MDTHPKGVSCPVPLSRPFAPVALAIGTLLRGKPNELDTVHLAAGHHAARIESLTERLKALRRASAFCCSVPSAGYCR